MAKKVAILAVDPVNGSGLFQYLESFFENDIPYRTFAVAKDRRITTNSHIPIEMDDVVANLVGKEDEYGAVVFACGDAVPKFGDNASEQYNKDMLAVLANFARDGKLLIGHCGAALIFQSAGIADGVKMAVHPYAKPGLTQGIGSDEKHEVDGNFYTAQTENSIWTMMDQLIEALKE